MMRKLEGIFGSDYKYFLGSAIKAFIFSSFANTNMLLAYATANSA